MASNFAGMKLILGGIREANRQAADDDRGQAAEDRRDATRDRREIRRIGRTIVQGASGNGRH